MLSIVHHRAVDAFRRESTRTSRNVRDEVLAERMAAKERTETVVEPNAEAARNAVHSKGYRPSCIR